jgi:phosphoketolase
MSADMVSAETALASSELELLDAYWRETNYLSVGQIYLLDNPLLRGLPAHLRRRSRPAHPLKAQLRVVAP